MDPRAVRWFQTERGISEETLNAFGLDFQDGLLRYPYTNGVKLRSAPWAEGDRKIWWEEYPGKDKIEMFSHPNEALANTVIIVEGESDCMKLWQEIHADGDAKPVSVYGVSGLSNWQDRYADLLSEATRVYVVLDQDDPYTEAAKAVEATWPRIKRSLGRKARRVQLPPGVKDICEFFKTYDLDAFRVLLRAANAPVWRYKALDTTKDLADIDWLVEPLLARGDTGMLYGPGGVGKSWYTMSLAVALTEGWDTWLGMKLPHTDVPVTYVDEENPEDVVLRRLMQLGHTPGNPKLRMLWYPGVRLDENPEYLYEDVESHESALLIVDSLSRIHTRNENSAEEMNPLINDGLLPIARHLNVTVLTIHHTPHDAKRARGSTVLGNAHDLTLSLQWRETKKGERMDSIILRPDKLRRSTAHPYIETKIVDTVPGATEDDPAERVAIEVMSLEGVPF